MAKRLTKREAAKICEYYKAGVPVTTISKKTRRSPKLIFSVLAKHGIKLRFSSVPYLPTPEEIAKATAEIRATWDEETHRARWVGDTSQEWAPPQLFTKATPFGTVWEGNGED